MNTIKIQKERITQLPTNNTISKNGSVVYWMSRDQRVLDSWALLKAQEIAINKEVPLIVLFCLSPSFLDATIRQYSFMLRGLQEIEKTLASLNISFIMLLNSPEKALPDFINQFHCSTVVCDFDPLPIKRNRKKSIASKLHVPLIEVDAHNIIPCRHISQKVEYGAYTLRPKINKLLPLFLTDFPPVLHHPFTSSEVTINDWKSIWKSLEVDLPVPEVDWLPSGEHHAHNQLNTFITQKLESYNELRNNPTFDAQSNLSPYLHFGQISSQRIALEINKSEASDSTKNSFLEELIVRKELSDNFCFYNPNYDNFIGFPQWAQDSLNLHRKDKREFLYTKEEFEQAKTHDSLWNAAQNQVIKTGKMHGYMRMYWAKKILEWSHSPEEAMAISIYLNDKYQLDGRDPNGYAGIAWSIGGVHDRAWFERPIYGKIRYMNANGCASKFDVKKYCSMYES